MTDVTDATFEQDVLALSEKVPVVVDLWAPWCGPCRTLGPIIERVVAATDGAVELTKVNIDENPQVADAFRVQSIPAVYALRDRKVIDGFIGALPEAEVRAFVARLAPPASEADQLAAAGDEASLRAALEIEPDHLGAIVALAELLVGRGEDGEALALLQRVPETPETRRVAALARLVARDESAGSGEGDSPATRLEALLPRVKEDEQARQEYLDLLETMDPEDPERSRYRRALASQLF
ncbi:MAG TPA: tetratricopeptide repeat protein [Acidimicrobiales bacterium]|nr:tetratricopeptide repeat protein [Acidimicrobiales bacterium]